jgi:hypothetical protein
MMRITKPKIFLLCLLILLTSGGDLRAEDSSQEYQLKLAFLVNFARFITWPEESFTPEHPQLTLCMLGKNAFGNALGGVEGKRVGQRLLEVKKIETLGKGQQCHLLFVGQSEMNGLVALGPMLDRQPIVTVSDSAGFAAAGGGIEFVLKDDKLAFVINNTAIKNRGVQVSSSLLNLAESIR